MSKVEALGPVSSSMTEFGKASGGGRRAAPRTQVPLIVGLSTSTDTQSATLTEISRTGAKLSGVTRIAQGQELEFRAGTVRAICEVIWSEGSECAIAFDIPIAIAEVKRLRSLANFIAGVSK